MGSFLGIELRTFFEDVQYDAVICKEQELQLWVWNGFTFLVWHIFSLATVCLGSRSNMATNYILFVFVYILTNVFRKFEYYIWSAFRNVHEMTTMYRVIFVNEQISKLGFVYTGVHNTLFAFWNDINFVLGVVETVINRSVSVAFCNIFFIFLSSAMAR